jgi:hypothetical protein
MSVADRPPNRNVLPSATPRTPRPRPWFVSVAHNECPRCRAVDCLELDPETDTLICTRCANSWKVEP